MLLLLFTSIYFLLLQILSEPEQRAYYDQFGTDPSTDTNQYSNHNFNQSPFASSFFGMNMNSGGRNNRNGPFQGFSIPLVYQVELTLEEIFAGKEISFKLSSANSNKSQKDDETVTVRLPPGLENGQRVSLNKEFIDQRGLLRRLSLEVQQLHHADFTREGNDLFTHINITLLEALLGFERSLQVIGNRNIRVTTPVKAPSSMVVADKDVFVIPGLGMPVFDASVTNQASQKYKYGDLFIEVGVVMPDRNTIEKLSPAEKQLLRELLNGGLGTTTIENNDSYHTNNDNNSNSNTINSGNIINRKSSSNSKSNNKKQTDSYFELLPINKQEQLRWNAISNADKSKNSNNQQSFEDGDSSDPFFQFFFR